MRWAEARVGPQRIRGAYAWRSLLNTGVVIPNGTDFPVEQVNPGGPADKGGVQQGDVIIRVGSTQVTSPDDALRGQLRITCSVSFAYAQIAAAIVDFLKLHPQLKVDLNASEGALNLVETRIDLAIRISAEPDPALIGRVLAPCTSVLVASPAYLADRGVPLVE